MPLKRLTRLLLLACVASNGLLARASADPGTLESLAFGPQPANTLKIDGPDARLQLLVTGKTTQQREIDQTRAATFRAEPEGIVRIEENGLVIPLADGTARLTAAVGEIATSTEITVEHFSDARPINFKNQIVPVFTKLGCNGGGCHGKASGQNGFRLSLLGFYPEDDYEFLVKESRGRRVFPAVPEKSLLLVKPTGQSPHGGGKRMEPDSHEYRLIRRWIEQGMPYGSASDSAVVSIECVPPARVMGRKETQQVSVYATYSSGVREDVTRMALYEPNDMELAETTDTGLVSTLDLSGEVAIMARYQGQVATFRATIPLGAPVESSPPVRNFIDEAVFAKLKLLGIPPSQLCDDATFLRRVSLDITGLLPTEAKVREFLADARGDKRERLIDELLATEAYADYFANKWNLVLRNKRRLDTDQSGTYAFHQWIWDSLYDNKPYDKFVRDLVTASGDAQWNPAVLWYREVSDVNEQVEDAAQLFLGVRIQCARCHHHPFERWSQDDYYGMAAFFSRVTKKDPGAEITRISRDKRVFHNDGLAQQQNPRTGVNLKPAGLGVQPREIAPEHDPRLVLADWMSEPKNPFFAKALVNRYWKHFFSRGIVEPEDDMRETNPPSNPELLNRLAASFVESGFDLKQLVKTICLSSTYQLTAQPNEYNLKDKQNFSRFYPRRLTAESLYDAFHQVAGAAENFKDMPAGSRAAELPDASMGPYFLKVFGQPQGDTACECERSQEANLAQSLHLLNSSEVQNKISSDAGRVHELAAQSDRAHAERIGELYRWTFAREPQPEELQIALAHIEQHKDNVQLSYEDIAWALINTKEFLFNH